MDYKTKFPNFKTDHLQSAQIEYELRKRKTEQNRNLQKELYLPSRYSNDTVLWCHVPEFLEQNTNNKTVEELTGGEEFWRKRMAFMQECYKELAPILDFEYNSKVWSDLSEDEREKLFYDIDYILVVSCNGSMGYHISGLYPDYDKILNLFNLPAKEAQRIVENNIFLGNVATCYSASLYGNASYTEKQDIKDLYRETLRFVEKPNVRFHCAKSPQQDLSEQRKNKKPLDYKKTFESYEHIISSMRGYTEKRRTF